MNGSLIDAIAFLLKKGADPHIMDLNNGTIVQILKGRKKNIDEIFDCIPRSFLLSEDD